MARFVDTYAPEEMPGYPCLSSPRWSTRIVQVDSGDEQTNSRWAHPLFRYTLPAVARKMEHYLAVYKLWMAMQGPARTFPFRDPLDFASVDLVQPNLEPTITVLDQVATAVDGSTTVFQLQKVYTHGDVTYTRDIILPVLSTLRVAVDGVEALGTSWLISTAYVVDDRRSVEQFDGSQPNFTCILAHTSANTNRPGTGANWETYWRLGGGPYTVTRPGGVLTFDTPQESADSPTIPAVVTAGFYFDVEVRFESDDAFDGMLKNWNTSGYADITLLEVRHCSDGE